MSKRRQRAIRQQKKEAASPQKAPKKGTTPVSTTSRASMTNWLLGLILILPFLYSRKPLDPVLTPRNIFLSIFMLLFVFIFFIWQKKIVSTRSTQIKIVFGLGIAFGVWSVVGLANAINYHEGYTDLSRHLLLLLLLFIIMNTVIQEESNLMKICKAVMLVALLQSFVGILQYYDVAFSELPGNYKPYGLMANRNLFGSAQVLVMPFVVYVLYYGARRWQIISALALIGLIVSIFISQTRSAWLSTFVFLIVSTFLILFFSKLHRKKWMIGSLAVLIISAGIISLIIITDKESQLSQSIKQRVESLTNVQETDNQAFTNIQERKKVWKKTVSIIADKPVAGVGLGNWKIAFPGYGMENMIFAKGFYIPDRPHNVYLHITSETGIPGAVFYFGMWLVIVSCGIMTILKTSNHNIRLLVILMLAGLGAFATDAMFNFPNERIEHSLYITLMGGIILGCYSNVANLNINKSGLVIKPIILVIITGFLLLNLFIGIKKYEFEVHWKYANHYLKNNRYTETIRETKKSRNEFVTMEITGKPIEIFSASAFKALKNNEAALKEIALAAKYNPNNSKIWNEWGNLYSEMKEYEKAIECYKKGLQLTPEYEAILKNLAVNYYFAGKYAECIETISKINIAGDPYWENLLNEAKRRQK